MGNASSTRWGTEPVRQDTDGLLNLDVRWLSRAGALEPGTVAQPSWTRRGEPSGTITTIMQRDGSLTLDYRIQRPGEDWQPVRERVDLDTTPCHFGGERVWFLCPGCESRRAVLFSVAGRFRCRHCHDLAYSSTREDATSRAIRRCAELRARLGGEPGQPVWTIPPKPPRMKWRRYRRIVMQLEAEIDRALGALSARLDKMSSNVDRLTSDPGATP